MPDLEDLAAKALSQRGDPYIFGAEARFDDANPRAFDCSELVEWSCARLGATFVDGAENQRNACRNAGTVMSVQDAIRTKGALLFRINVDGDHVAISLGDGKTIEARGSAYGVNVFDAVGRTWTDGGFPPGFGRDGRPTGRGNELGDRMLERGDRGEDVRWVQRRLQVHGFDAGAPDGIFGPRTEREVRAFQDARDIECDGVVGPITRRALRARPPKAAPKEPAAAGAHA